MSDYTRVVNAADAWGSVPLTACGWCGVFVADPHLHDRWCPGKEHERMLEGYAKVYKELKSLAPDNPVYRPGGHVEIEQTKPASQRPTPRSPFDHKEP